MPDEAPGPGRPGRALDEAAAREADHAARLLGYLRDLARARRRPSRDLADHDHVHWLAGLPGDVYVEADAGPGEVLFSVPVIPLTPPVVLEEFDGWLALRNWYRVLRELAGEEAVLATGLLSWRPAVHDHLLSTPVRIVLDERTERVDVVLAGHTTLRDRELLSGHPGFRPADWIADAVQAGQGFGLSASVGDVLRKWCQVALTSPADYREDWTPDADTASPVPRLRLAPALVVRPAGCEAVADHHARLLSLLPRGVPEGVARFVSPDLKPQVMHIPERAPETVPDLLAGLLARGRRVLVATSGPAASAALRGALPPGLAALTATDAAMAARVADAVRAAGAPELDALAEREEAAALRVAEITERLRGGGPAEPPPDLRGEEPELSWMPVRPDLPPGPPISRSEAAELVVLLAEETAERKARTEQRDVDPGALPSAAYVRTLIEAEAAAAERAERSRTELSQLLRDSDVTLLARLDGDASVVGAALRDLGLEGHPGGWNPSDLAVRALGDALAERRPLIWARVVEMTSRAQWAERALGGLSGHRVELPSDADLRGLAAAAQDLRAYLADGGVLKRGPLRSGAQRQAEPLLATVKVDGAAPTTPELLDIAHTDLMVRITCRELQYVWEAAGISFPADLPPGERVARFVRAHARLARVRDAMTALDSTRRLLERSGFRVPLVHPIQWHDYAAALRNALEGLGVSRATADLDALRDSIGPVGVDDPPELGAALAAVDARDAAAYGRALGALAEARHERSRQIRCEELVARVRAVHPDLANLLIATDGDEVWHDRARRWDDAWTWARRRAASTGPAAADRLRDALAEAESALREARAGLTAARAAASALARSGPDIVPAWILPLWRVPDVLPPAPDDFDVVIVDGEHEAGAEALFVLWHAPRTILVGPSGPGLPPPEGPPPGLRLPSHLHEVITPTTPLFAALTTPRTAPPPAARPMSERPDVTQRDIPIQPPTPRPPRKEADPRIPDPRAAERPEMTRQDLRPQPPARAVPPAAPRKEEGTRPRDPRPLERPKEDVRGRPPRQDEDARTHAPRAEERPEEPRRDPRARPPARPQGPAPAPGDRPDVTQQDVRARPPARPGTGASGQGVPPRRLDAARRESQGEEQQVQSRPGGRGGSLPPRRLDAVRRDEPAREPGAQATGPNPRTPEAGHAPPHGRSDIPAIWGKPGPLPNPPQPPPRQARPPQQPQPRPQPEPAQQQPRSQPEVPPQPEPTQQRAQRDQPRPQPEASQQQAQAGPRAEGAGPAEPPRQQEQSGAQGPVQAEGAGRRPAGGGSAGQTRVRRGRSIASYKRPELIEIVGHVAELEPDLTDDQVVELVTRLLGCPEDEALLVGARLRYAVEVYREGAG
ncbi:hypothetical protein BKA00_004410 [Actinomadura coerulea]|uniref:Uncharacterized protein n=1 Tax=Actinomadura coerulea TaxID=46159 RepID=A0A7X0G329_9ACTN|nr:hypothetical protein [Actinomadura coerulea]MBB6397496.1 hypothetical protein [Actinomadura coerulea]GGQ03020.1 hypothetical protein GCM10010187_18640 [Actinomadura coerulea]